MNSHRNTGEQPEVNNESMESQANFPVIPKQQDGTPFDEHVQQSIAVANSGVSSLEGIDFDGLDATCFGLHDEYGPLVHKTKFMKWLGIDPKNAGRVEERHLRPGDLVRGVFRPIGRENQRGRKADALTKRGVRRLLFRSNHPKAIEYADRVLDMLDELDRHGMVVDEQRITEEQIQAGRERLDRLAQARIEERMDYKYVLNSIKAGGATESLDYARVQNALYRELFGTTARQIIKTRTQLTGTPKKRGEGFCKSLVAKDYLTESELRLMQGVVLNVVSQLHVLRPDGATADEIIAMVEHAVGFLDRRGAA